MIRVLSTTPAFSVSVVLTLALGIGLGAPVLGMVRLGLRSPAMCMDRLLCGSESIPDWLPQWTAEWQSIVQLQSASVQALLWIVLALSLLLLTTALINLLTLLLTRAAVRRPEIALRVALGAVRGRLAGHLLSEGSIPVLLGVVLGLAIAAAGAGVLSISWPLETPPWGGAPLDGAVLVGVPGALVLTTLVVWLSPVRVAWRRDLSRLLTAGGRITAGRGEALVRNTLVVVQLAASLALLASAGLLLRSFASPPAEQRLDFEPRSMLSAQVHLPAARYAGAEQRARFYEDSLERIRTLPGVVSASLATAGAWVGLGVTDRVTAVCEECFIGMMYKPVSRGPARIHAVSPDFFQTLGIPVLSGRGFRAEEQADDARVAVVSRTFAYRLIPNGEPLGKAIQIGGRGGDLYRIIGVVDDLYVQGIGASAAPVPALYLPLLEHPPRSVALAVRTAGDPMRFAPVVERVVQREGPGADWTSAMTMEQYLTRHRAPLRWFASLLGVLAAVVLVLATSGLYGVMSYNVARRTREIGIRLALGARSRTVLRMILRQSLHLTWFGVVLGVIAVSGLARLLQLLVHGVELWDPTLYSALAGLLAIVTLLASYRPAKRAASVDPQISLREE